MDCPRCGAATDGSPDCPRCGVILAKARRAGPKAPALRAGPEPAAAPAAGHGVLLGVLTALALLFGAILYSHRASRSSASSSRLPVAAAPVPDPAGTGAGTDLPELVAPPIAPAIVAVPDPASLASTAAQQDRAGVDRLASRLRSRALLRDDDLRLAEELYARYPIAAGLLEAVLVRTAQQEQAAQRHAAAASLLLRALSVAPQSVPARRALLAVRAAQTDWPATESVARELLNAVPGDAEVVRALAYALVRQDRGPEALELLTGHLQAHADPASQALLDRIRSDDATEASLGKQNLAHFHVRYDGGTHEEAGRLVLRVLDRHYATLVATFAHEPSAPIPVILLSEQRYYDATGAPAWAGGHYDNFDGRVRIPIAGLSSSPPSDLDEVVLHELTHAFVAELSAGLAPRELHEGLAQLMQGRRSAALLGNDGLRALADGRLRGVDGFYFSALVFVEDLVAQRGQGGINDVLAAMARTRDVDEACRQVYGKDWRSLLAEWSVRFRRRYAG